jgi:hypothetical protein
VVCDFQAIYRIRIDPDTGDFAGLTGPQFLRYASRLPGYQGVMRIRAQHAEQPPPDAGTTAAGQALDASPLMLTTQPLLAGFIEYSAAPPAD